MTQDVMLCRITRVSTLDATQWNARIDSDPIPAFRCVVFMHASDLEVSPSPKEIYFAIIIILLPLHNSAVTKRVRIEYTVIVLQETVNESEDERAPLLLHDSTEEGI